MQNTGIKQADSKPTISFNQDTKLINWQTSLFTSSNCSSTTSVLGFATSTNSGNAFKRLPEGENYSFRTGKRSTELVDTQLTQLKSVQWEMSDHSSSSANNKLRCFKPGLGSIVSRETDGEALVKR